MKTAPIHALWKRPLTVGSVGDAVTLQTLNPQTLTKECDVMEIRLDGLSATSQPAQRPAWQRFEATPLLFTARCQSEGGALAWDAAARSEALIAALPDAALIDIEAANIDHMESVIRAAASRNIPWIASYHDFEKLPDEASLVAALEKARAAGASAFKWAAYLHSEDDTSRMIDFQGRDHGIPVASMGMGPLGAESRVLAAGAGSVLNYGYLGAHPTAPGQWHAGRLKEAISRLPTTRAFSEKV